MKLKIHVAATISVLPFLFVVACQDGQSPTPNEADSSSSNLSDYLPAPAAKKTPPPPGSGSGLDSGSGLGSDSSSDSFRIASQNEQPTSPNKSDSGLSNSSDFLPIPSQKATPLPSPGADNDTSSNTGFDSNLTRSPVDFFTDEEVIRWTTEKILQIPTDQISRISTRQIKLLSPDQLQSFTLEQISELRPEQVEALGSRQGNASLLHLSRQQLHGLGSNLFGLSDLSLFDLCHALSPDQVEHIFKKNCDGKDFLSSTILYKIYEHRIKSKSVSCRWEKQEIKDVSSDKISNFDEKEIREFFIWAEFFTPAQIKALDLKFIKFFWSLPLLSKEQFQVFTGEQLNLLSHTQVQVLTEDQRVSLDSNIDQVRELNKDFISAVLQKDVKEVEDQVRSIPSHLIENLGEHHDYPNLKLKFMIRDCKFLDKDQFQAILSTGLKFFSKADIECLDISQLASFSPAQIKEIHASAIPGFSTDHITHLTEAQIKALTEAQIKALTVDQLRAILNQDDKSKAFTPDQIKHVSDKLIKELGTSHLVNLVTADNIPHLTLEQFTALTVSQMNALVNYSDRVAAFTPDQIKSLRPEFLNKLDILQIVKLLAAQHIPHLTREQIRAFNSDYMNAIVKKDDRVQAFTPDQIQSLRPELLNELGNHRSSGPRPLVKLLTPQHIPHLTQEQLQTFTADALRAILINEDKAMAFTSEQIRSLKPKLFTELGTHHSLGKCPLFNLLTAEKIPHLTQEQFEGLTEDQIKVLGACQNRREALLKSNFLDSHQKEVLKPNKSIRKFPVE